MSYSKTIVCLANSRKLMAAVSSAAKPRLENCHRRIVAEYLQSKWGGVEIEHIL